MKKKTGLGLAIVFWDVVFWGGWREPGDGTVIQTVGIAAKKWDSDTK